jgi:hypothetical protein
MKYNAIRYKNRNRLENKYIIYTCITFDLDAMSFVNEQLLLHHDSNIFGFYVYSHVYSVLSEIGQLNLSIYI